MTGLLLYLWLQHQDPQRDHARLRSAFVRMPQDVSDFDHQPDGVHDHGRREHLGDARLGDRADHAMGDLSEAAGADVFRPEI